MSIARSTIEVLAIRYDFATRNYISPIYGNRNRKLLIAPKLRMEMLSRKTVAACLPDGCGKPVVEATLYFPVQLDWLAFASNQEFRSAVIQEQKDV
jgi:hypothetical protein